MKQNEPRNPIAISLLGAQTVMLQTQRIAHLFEERFLLALPRPNG
jgi:hypothetical protein